LRHVGLRNDFRKGDLLPIGMPVLLVALLLMAKLRCLA
jgi:hypothetical protein